MLNVIQHYCNIILKYMEFEQNLKQQCRAAEDSCAATVNQLFNISILISEYCLYALCENFE